MSVLVRHQRLPHSNLSAPDNDAFGLERGLDIRNVEDLIRDDNVEGLNQFLEESDSEQLKELVLDNPQTLVTALQSNNVEIGKVILQV